VAVPLAGQTPGQCRIATGSNAAASGSIAANVSRFPRIRLVTLGPSGAATGRAEPPAGVVHRPAASALLPARYRRLVRNRRRLRVNPWRAGPPTVAPRLPGAPTVRSGP
jgi:hypothetical protein